MDFTLTEEQKQIKALVKEFCEREVDIKRMDELTDKVGAARTVEEVRALYPTDLLEKLHDVGLRQLCVPEKYGGGGAQRFGSVTRAVAAEQAGYYMGVASRLITLPWMHCVAIGGYQTTEEQKDWFFSQFMEDHTLWTALIGSEPQGLTDQFLPYTGPGAQMNTFAYKDGSEWVINGDKMFSSGAPVAGLLRVTAFVDKEKPPPQTNTSFWVKKDTPGLTYTLNRMSMEEVCGNAQTHLDNVRIPETHLIGEVGKGGPAMAELIGAKMVLFVDFLGHAQKIYEQLVDYAKQRVQGGQPIIQHPNIAAMLGELAVSMEAARSYAYRSAWEMDEREKAGEPLNNFWSLGNFYLVKQVAWRLCEIIPEVYGGISGSVDLPFERFLRRVFSWYPSGGTPTMSAIMCSMNYNKHILG